MFSLVIVLLSFSESLARDQIKCLLLNDEPCMVRLTLIDMNPVKLKVGLSPSKKVCVICLIESPLKMMKNAFLFHLGSSFPSQVI